jgi:ADP-ribose pyrophosphatase
MKPPEKLSSELIYKGHLKIRIDKFQMADGSQATREIIEHTDCIAVIPVDENDNVLLVSQYREAVGKELLEIVAGGIDQGEEVETAVKREMQEETGYLPQKLQKLGGYYLAPGYSTEFMHLYTASALVPSRLTAEDTETIQLVRVPVSQIPQLLTSGKITDGKSIAGLYMFLEYREKNTKS